jgi:hypothetical protein
MFVPKRIRIRLEPYVSPMMAEMLPSRLKWLGAHLQIEWDKQQSTYDKNSSCNQQLYLMQSAFISNLVGVVVNMMIQ